jgi:glycosyltransferase involved in cell wall biosynthesis
MERNNFVPPIAMQDLPTFTSEARTDLELTIVMPCLNEAETLGICISKAADYLKRSGVSGEIVIGDNGSTDGSQQIARDLGARVIDIPVRGYGAALFGACSVARGRYIIMGDSDDSYDFSNLDSFISKLRDGYDLVMGNRFTGEIKAGAMPWKNRHIGNPILSGIGKALFRSPLGDFHCGIRGFSKAAFLRLNLRTTGMEFASEMVIKATLMQLKLADVPTTLSPDGRSRPPHLRPFRDGWRHLRFMLLFSPNWLFLYPGLIAIAVCLAVGSLLLRGPVTFAGINLDIDTLIYAAFGIAVGFQTVLFAFLSRVYAVQEGLYPSTTAFRKLRRQITLERGLIAGTLILVSGFSAAVIAVMAWKRASFGQMDFNSLSRIVIPSALFVTLGFEIILFSFFFSTLELNIRHYTTSISPSLKDTLE